MGFEFDIDNFTEEQIEERKKELINSLDEDQKLPVMHLDGNLLVEAGAGSGKTRVLTSRVYNLLLNGVYPEDILMLTFTNKAAKEMQERIASLVGYSIENIGITCGTFHSVGIELLRNYINILNLGFTKEFSILEETDKISMMKDLLKKHEHEFLKASEVIEVISLSLNALSKVSVLVKDFKHLEPYTDKIIEIGKEFLQEKKKLNTLDYDDILFYLYLLLKNHENVRKKLQQLYPYILVDEFQDTCILQDRIIKLIETGNTMIVGDINQSLYSWRGAEIGNILSYRNANNVITYGIGNNYRSQENIVNFALDVIKKNTIKAEVDVKPQLPPTHPVEIFSVKDRKTEAEFIITEFIKPLIDSGEPLDNIAILYRNHEFAKEIEMELIRQELEYDLRSGKRFVDRKHIRDMISYLRVVNNPKDLLAWKRISFNLKGIGKKGSEILMSGAATEGCISIELLDKLRGKKKNSDIEYFAKIYNADREKLVTLLATEDAEFGNYVQDILRNYFEAIYLNKLEGLVDGGERIADVLRMYDLTENNQTLDSYLDTILISESMDLYKTEGKIVLSSIHKSKGLEWDYVFLLGCNQGSLPNDKALESKNPLAIEEERRLLYVGATRARKVLRLFYVRSAFDFRIGSFVNKKVSNFLLEVDESLYSHYVVD